MKHCNVRPMTLLLCLFVLHTDVRAGGYQINEHGIRAMGLGGAFVAQASDASAVFFNPAGLAFQGGTRILGGSVLILPRSSFVGPSPSTTETSMVDQVFYPSHLYITHSFPAGLSFGLGAFSPFGLGTEWPKDWEGRKLAVKSDMHTFYINPTIAYRLSDRLAIGGGVSYVLGDVLIRQRVPTVRGGMPSPDDGTVTMEGDGSSVNFNLGVLFKPTDELAIGLAYRHLTEITLKGTAKFENMQDLTPYFPGGNGSTTLPLPLSLQAGVAYRPTNEFTVEIDAQFMGWSAYDELRVEIDEGPPFPLTGRPLQTSTTYKKEWKDNTLIRIGAEYRLERIALRAGYIFDPTPQPNKSVEPMLPDADRHEVTLGFGVMLSGSMSLDAAYQLVLFQDRTVVSPENTFPGTYKTTANLIGVNIGYQF